MSIYFLFVDKQTGNNDDEAKIATVMSAGQFRYKEKPHNTYV